MNTINFKKRLTLNLIFLMSLFFAEYCCAGPNSLDIFGFRLGMTPEEVKSVMTSKGITGAKDARASLTYRPGDHISRTLPNSEFLVSQLFNVNAADGTGYIKLLYSPEHGNEKVVAIVRLQNFSAGSRPTRDVLLKSLAGKYGQWQFETKIRKELIWSFDKTSSTKAYKGGDDALCGLEGNGVLSIDRDLSLDYGRRHMDARDACGDIYLKVAVTMSGQEDFVGTMLASLYDYNAIFAAQDRVSALIESQIKQASGEERSNAKTNGPQL